MDFRREPRSRCDELEAIDGRRCGVLDLGAGDERRGRDTGRACARSHSRAWHGADGRSAHDSVAQAIAIRDGKVLKVGTDVAILAMAGPNTQVIDLHGRTATPGLIDSHAHVADGGVGEVMSVQLSDATSVDEIVRRVRAKAAQLKPGEWIRGEGWDEGKLREHRLVLATDLDAAAPDNPVWLEQTTGHYGVANSDALRVAKVSANTPDPPAGTIDHDRAGAPTGVLKEGAEQLVTTLIPPPTDAQWRQGILRMIETLHSEGMTAYKDPDDTQPMWNAYRELLDAGQLTVRVCVLWHAGSTVESAQAVIKTIQALPRPRSLSAMGACSPAVPRSIWMAPAPDAPRGSIRNGAKTRPRSIAVTSVIPPRIRWCIGRWSGCCIRPAFMSARTRSAIAPSTGSSTPMPRCYARSRRGVCGMLVIHANLPTEHAFEVMARCSDNTTPATPKLNRRSRGGSAITTPANLDTARALRIEPLKTLLARGVQWTGGSDFNVTPLPRARNPRAAVERKNSQRASTGLQPLRHGRGRGCPCGAEGLHGRGRAESCSSKIRNRLAEPGKEADIAVWDRKIPPTPLSGAALKDMKCEITLFHGKVVYEQH